MSKSKLKTVTSPCDNCPFRRSAGGYLRQDRAEEIADVLRSDGHFHCHKTVDYSDEDGEGRTGDAALCAGSLVVQIRDMGYVNQLARIEARLGILDLRKIEAMADDRDADVYDNFDDFIEAHDS